MEEQRGSDIFKRPSGYRKSEAIANIEVKLRIVH
jgi:hypothetical protein